MNRYQKNQTKHEVQSPFIELGQSVTLKRVPQRYSLG